MTRICTWGAAAVSAVALSSCGGAPPPEPPPPPPPIETAAPAPGVETVAAPEAGAAVSDGALAWECSFDDVKGWYDNRTDPTYAATIQPAPGGKARVTEAGPDVWGKVAIFCPGIDFSRGPVLEIVVDAAEGATWKAGVVPQPWNDAEFKSLVESTSSTGSTTVDMAARSGWSGAKDVNLVLFVEGEGRAVLFDAVRIRYTT